MINKRWWRNVNFTQLDMVENDKQKMMEKCKHHVKLDMVENDKQKMEDKCKLYAIRYGGEW